MIGGLKPYPDYKDSGVEWLGQVPGHWQVRRLKSSVTNVVDQAAERRANDLYVALEHVESWTGRIKTANDDVAFDSQVKRFRAGDVLFGKLRPYLAKVARPNVDGVCVGEFLVLRLRGQKASSEYLEKLLRSKPVIDAVNSSTFGAKMPRADWRFVGGMRITVPPLPEQTAIVRFLDYVDRRVRRVIRARQRLVKLLEEYRQALIHQAVTGRIDVRTGQPYPQYKDSGVEWLGDVPAHWEVVRLRYLVEGKLTYGANEAAEHTNPDWPRYLRITDFAVDGSLRDETFRSLDPDIARDYLVEPGDLLLARSGATVGKAFLVPTDLGTACHAGYLIRARPRRDRVIPEYLFAFTQSSGFARWKDSTFIIATIHNIGADKYADLLVPLPPLPEQTAIVEYLDEQTGKIDRAADAARRGIELLKEFRTRLIADVVTGKLDVREVAARLPEEPEEPEPLDEPEDEIVIEKTGDDLEALAVEAET